MKVTNVVVVAVVQNIDLQLKSISTMELFNVGDTVAMVNGVTLNAGDRKTLVVADGTVSDLSLEVVFSTEYEHLGWTKRLEIIYKKILPCESSTN